MSEISIEEVEKFLRETKFEFNPGQDKVSFPIIQRIYLRLSRGVELSPIKVVNTTIVDGHHRFIGSKLLGLTIEKIPGGANNTNPVECKWETVSVESIDYDTEADKLRFAEEFDKA